MLTLFFLLLQYLVSTEANKGFTYVSTVSLKFVARSEFIYIKNNVELHIYIKKNVETARRQIM